MKRLLLLAEPLLPLLPALAEEPSTPAALRERFLGWRLGMFIHFNMATFNNQWATGTEDPATFAPTNLDCGQWLDAAKAAGMYYAVLTVKRLREIGARLAVPPPGPDKP